MSEALHHLAEEDLVFEAKPAENHPTLIDKAKYEELYKRSVEDPEGFWAEQAERIDWFKKWDTVKNTSYGGDVSIKWFEGGTLNVSHNCIDRHLEERGEQTAIIWEGDDPNDAQHITYNELHKATCRMANVLKDLGVKKGDRVTIYMPMIPEAAYAMLACTRIGAVHSVVFGGFSPEALKGRIIDCQSQFVITADEGVRGGKSIPLKANVDKALKPPLPSGEGSGEAAGEGKKPPLNSDLLSFARELRKNSTDAEKIMWKMLRDRRLNNQKFRRQHPIGNYIADFFCMDKGLVIELDGGQHSEQKEHDKKRTKYMEEQGYKVLRFWNNDILENLEGVIETILKHLESPHPNPLPEGEEIKVLVVKRTGGEITWQDGRDHWYHEEIEKASDDCPPEEMDAEDPLFILYTSGSTGKPKGVLHTTGGYIVYTSLTHETVFNYQPGDIYWCTADVGWVTGHSYIIYGPLANGATTLMFEGVPNYPDISRFWQVVDKHKVTQFYTAPTAIRALMAQGEDPVKQTDRSSLRILGSVGEPINPEAWLWYHNVVGEGKCPIVDTWWQTETGGFLITPFPHATDLKPGSATFPFFGVQPAIVDNEGNILEGEAEGALCILDSWPSQMRTVFGNHKRFVDTYFSQYPGKYFTGDGARRDADGYYWITGRMDDVLNVSGHRLGTAEIESALVAHENVAEAAVVGYPHDIKGQGIYAFVTLNSGIEGSDELKDELKNWVRKEIGPIAKPDLIQWAPGLPKTRSGKIMRRICRKIAHNEVDNFGETSTLLNPEAVDDLVENRLNK